MISGFSLIDDGKNPDEFTKDVINSCIAKNQMTKGKTDALKVDYIPHKYCCFHFKFHIFISFFSLTCHFCFGQSLRKHLLEELEQNFPDEVETFRESRAAAAAVSKIFLFIYFIIAQNI